MDERQFFTEKPEQRVGRFQCTRCRRTNEFQVRWIRRTRKAQPPGGSDVEVMFHGIFAPDHIRGEWFRRSPVLVEFIEALTKPAPMYPDG